jgi:hypothetical protein
MLDSRHFLLPPYERGRLDGQVVGMGVEGPQGQKINGQAGNDKLKEVAGIL